MALVCVIIARTAQKHKRQYVMSQLSTIVCQTIDGLQVRLEYARAYGPICASAVTKKVSVHAQANWQQWPTRYE